VAFARADGGEAGGPPGALGVGSGRWALVAGGAAGGVAGAGAVAGGLGAAGGVSGRPAGVPAGGALGVGPGRWVSAAAAGALGRPCEAPGAATPVVPGSGPAPLGAGAPPFGGPPGEALRGRFTRAAARPVSRSPVAVPRRGWPLDCSGREDRREAGNAGERGSPRSTGEATRSPDRGASVARDPDAGGIRGSPGSTPMPSSPAPSAMSQSTIIVATTAASARTTRARRPSSETKTGRRESAPAPDAVSAGAVSTGGSAPGRGASATAAGVTVFASMLMSIAVPAARLMVSADTASVLVRRRGEKVRGYPARGPEKR
jgi:hypothetical protein